MIWIVILLAFVLRFITLNQSLWLDEADNVVAASMFDLVSFVTKYSIGDYHPPGYFILLWVWTHLFGFSEIIVRFPSVILGVGTIYFTYLLGKQLFDKNTALLTALFLAVAPLHVYYSQEARMYSFSAFSVAALSYFLIQLVHGKKWSLLGYSISAVLVLYSDYVTYLIFPVHFLYLFISQSKVWKTWFVSLLIASVAFLPWLSVFPQQIAEGQKAAINLPGWKQVAGGADYKNLALVWVKTLIGRISFEDKIIYGGVVGIFSLLWGIGVIKGVKNAGKNNSRFLLTWLLVPLILAWGISFFIPMLSYFRMLYILPAFYLLVAKGVLSFPENLSRVLIIALVFGSLFSLGIYYQNPKFQREDWRGAVEFINNLPGSDFIILFEDNHVKFPYLYYSEQRAPSFGGLQNIQAKTDKDVKDLNQILDGKNKIYVFEYLVEITDPNRLLQKKIVGLGFEHKDVYNFNGVGLVRLYEKN